MKNILPGKKEVILKTKWFTFESEEFNHIPALDKKPFYRLHIPDSIMVLAITMKREIVFVRQFRPASKQYTLELPAGMIDKNEKPKEAAKRELYEETGYRCRKLVPLGKVSAGIDRLDGTAYIFFGRGAVADSAFNPEEGISVKAIPLAHLKRQMNNNFELRQLSSLGIILFAKWMLMPEELKDL